MRLKSLFSAVIATLAIVAVSRGQDDVKSVFDSLYGEELKRARATPDGKDDLALAEKMLDATQSIDETKLIALICNTAFDLAERQRTGGPVAGRAIHILIEKAPAEAGDARSRLTALLRKQFAAARADARAEAGEQLMNAQLAEADYFRGKGQASESLAAYRGAAATAAAIKSPRLDEVKFIVDGALARAALETSAARLLERIKANPSDAAAHRDLAKLYAVDLDDPAKALPYAEKSGVAAYEKLLPLAAGPPDKVQPADALELADWYRSAGSEPAASTATKVAMLRRAESWYQRFLAANKEAGLTATKAKLSLGEVTSALARLNTTSKPAEPPATSTRPATKKYAFDEKMKVLDELREVTADDEVLDLTKHIDTAHRRTTGSWEVKKDKMHVRGSVNLLAHAFVPLTSIDADFDYEVRFERVGNEDFDAIPSMSMGFPVPKHATLTAVTGMRRDYSGLEGIEQNKAVGDTIYGTQKVKFAPRRMYTTFVSVRTVEGKSHVQMAIDGKVISEWKGDAESLYTHTPRLRYVLAIMSYGEIVIHRVALKVHAGKFYIFR